MFLKSQYCHNIVCRDNAFGLALTQYSCGMQQYCYNITCFNIGTMSVTNQHARLTVNRIFEVISPLTIGHILTCQSVAIFTCQNCHNIYISILLPPLRARAVRCSGLAPITFSFSKYPETTKVPIFRMTYFPACGWALIIGRCRFGTWCFQ